MQGPRGSVQLGLGYGALGCLLCAVHLGQFFSRVAAEQGVEFYGKGANIHLGPGLNIARVPHNGRNFGALLRLLVFCIFL